MPDGGSKLFTEGVGYFVMVCDLAVLEGDRPVWRSPGFLVGHLSDEPPQWSGVLCAVDGLHPPPPPLPVVYCSDLVYLLVEYWDLGMVGVVRAQPVPLPN